MSKNKKSGITAQKAKAQEIESRKIFASRIKLFCEALAGPGYFEKISSSALAQMHRCRYPTLKAKADPEKNIPKSKVVQYNKLMNKFIEDMPVNLTNGNSVPMRLYLSEGLLLLNFIRKLPESDFKKAFEPYFQEEDEDEDLIIEMLATLIHDTNIFLSDLNHSIFNANIGETSCFDEFALTNDVLIQEFKPEKSSVCIDGRNRSIIRVGWVEENMDWLWADVKPSQLGFNTGESDTPVKLYIQQHALLRMQERIDITPGIMHYMIFILFKYSEITYHKNEDHSLVAFKLSDEKVGYLLVTLNDHKLIIQTFLFLTNDGTPEGKKLKHLLEISRMDKEHLMIDRLPTFNSYHFDKDEKLSQMFKDADCGSLLNLGHLQKFSMNEVKDKDPESILKYLSDAAYFKNSIKP